MDVIDAFNLNSCDDTELENFPTCTDPYRWVHGSEEIDVLLWAEEHCCFGFTTPEWTYIDSWGYRWKSTCHEGDSYVKYAKGLHLRQDPGEEGLDDEWLTANDDIGDANWDEGTELVDVLYDELPMTGEDLVFCELCVIHETCADNTIEGTDLTLFDKCTAKNCCSPPEGYDPSDYTPVEGEDGTSFKDLTPPSYNSQSLGGAYVSQNKEAPGLSCHACDTFGMCNSPNGYAVCAEKGCCKGLVDPVEPDWIPEPLPDDNVTEATAGEITDSGATDNNPPF